MVQTRCKHGAKAVQLAPVTSQDAQGGVSRHDMPAYGVPFGQAGRPLADMPAYGRPGRCGVVWMLRLFAD